ncbi:hypothetical protein Pcinc_004596 [Petrolisthes cinctipes]|uniref:Methyltransferase domain-containing protein n=1 Tax=Petrolisthes cinctipes TaxID=88211 RepID=A0AAE1GGJ5_PETCI|nr:hypothetical protein Pcinc_004596 [Petrolisthes cinctipes]
MQLKSGKNLELVKEDILKVVQTCPIPNLHDIQLEFDYGKNTKRYACANKTQLGGIMVSYRQSIRPFLDGEKWICYEPSLDPDPKDCLVYSFGIGNEWSFDDAMDKYGCQVYSFDPTMNRPNFKRGSNIYFKNLGLEGYKGTLPEKEQSKVDTLGNIMRMLGHEGRRIDYLKIDIEGSEIPALEQVFSDAPHLLTQVSQLGMEVHPGIYRDTPHTTTIPDVTCGRLTTHMYLTSQQAQASATTLIAPKEPPHSNKDTTNLTMPSDHGELQKSSLNSTTKPKHRPLPRAPWRDLLSPTKTKRKAPHTSAPRLRNNFDI